jgi:DNA-binding transcriptional regulator YiaG
LPAHWSQLGLTVPEIAADMGVPKRTLAQWIRGDRQPRKEGRQLIQRYLEGKGLK